MNGTLLESALAYLASGICALPAKRKAKRPNVSSWSEYQSRLPSPEELTRLFSGSSSDGLCIVCGKISGNLEVIDFDQKAVAFDAWRELVGSELVSRLVIQRSQNGGKHVLYRCEGVVGGNQKLAEDKFDGEKRVLIETRAEGGLVICAPTDGYEVEQGSLLDLPVLTAEQRNRMVLAAWGLGDHSVDVVERSTMRVAGSDARPGDDYNKNGDIGRILERHGWKCTQRGENEHWLRPGKSEGTSATFNGKHLYVFSSSTPFEPCKAYTKFFVYATLEHGGDLRAATIRLREEGWGAEEWSADELHEWGQSELPDESTEMVSVLEPEPVASAVERPALPESLRFPPDLLEVPGFVGDFIQYCRDTCFLDQPALFLAAGLALQGVLAGRKICDIFKNRPHIYTLGVSATGTGKDWPREVVSELLEQIKAGHLGGLESPKSGNGLVTALSIEPARIAMIDEFGRYMSFNSTPGMPWLKEFIDYLLKLFSAGGRTFYAGQTADRKKCTEIDRPSLSLFATTVGDSLWKNLRVENITDGLLSRMLIFHGENFPARGSRDPFKPFPPKMLAHAMAWYSGAAIFDPDSDLIGTGVSNHDEKVAAMDSDAEARIRQIMDLPYKHPEATEDAQALATRTAQLTCKLALIYACSECALEPRVTLQGVEWGYRLAVYSRQVWLYVAHNKIAESDFDGRCKAVVDWMRAVGGAASKKDIGRRFRRWSTRERDEVLSNLVDSGLANFAMAKTGGRDQLVYRLT